MLKKIATCIRENKNIIEKKEITSVVQYIDSNSYKSKRIFSDIGEDSAAISNKDTFTLVTTDRIKTKFIENFPFGAGFSSILVGVDDIFACGGQPLAASIIISFKDASTGQKIIAGVCEGSNKFKIPIIRGHTNTKDHYELSSTMIGEIKKEHYISAKNAKIGDNVILAVDIDGKVGKASNLYWDTTTFKSSEEILKKRKAMCRIAENRLANASKDISNGGIFGTILQLIRYSSVGANININKIQIPTKLQVLGYTLDTYIKMYLTTSYILTAPDENCEKIRTIFKEKGLEAQVIGKIINETNLLQLNDGNTTIDVLKF
ncbi:MAG: AIR synthase-related protein [Promethearchaeota archaeon]